jgi:hypothetical protein
VRPLGVVVGGEGIELGLQAADRDGRFLAAEPFVEGLVEPFDLPAGLRVVRPAVAEPNAQGGELTFERDPPAAAVKTVKTAPLSVSIFSGRPWRAMATCRSATMSPALKMARAVEAASSRE